LSANHLGYRSDRDHRAMTRHGLATPFSESLMLSVTMSLALATPPIASVTISSPGLGQHSRCKPPAKATSRPADARPAKPVRPPRNRPNPKNP